MHPELLRVKVALRMRWYNRNYVGVHYGGSLYSMCDPWYMLMLMQQLGREYIIWDKAANIRFKSPGKGTVTAEFELTEEQVKAIKVEVDAIGKKDFIFNCLVKNKEGEIVAEVDKTVYVRRMDFNSKKE